MRLVSELVNETLNIRVNFGSDRLYHEFDGIRFKDLKFRGVEECNTVCEDTIYVIDTTTYYGDTSIYYADTAVYVLYSDTATYYSDTAVYYADTSTYYGDTVTVTIYDTIEVIIPVYVYDTLDCEDTLINHITPGEYTVAVLYPNPSSSYITVTNIIDPEFSYHIYNMEGRIVDQGIIGPSYRVNTNNLASGTYYILFTRPLIDEVFIGKFIKLD